MSKNESLIQYGTSFQSKIISSLLVNNKFIKTVYDILEVSYFDSDANKFLITEIRRYFDKYKTPPTMEALKVEIDDLDNDTMKTAIVDSLRNAWNFRESPDLEFVQEKTLEFCKNQVIKSAIMQSVELLDTQKYDEIKGVIDNAMKAGVERDIGHEYITGFEERMNQQARQTVATKWDSVNDLMDGGLGPGELGVVVAPSGVGKTWILTALGADAVKRGLSVVHYSMELSEHYVGARYDTVFTQIPSSELKERKEDVKNKIQALKGNLLIKYFPPKGVSVKKLQMHIEKMITLDNKPDLIIVDYADLLLSDSNKTDSTYAEQGGVYIDLRGMGGHLEIPVWTASQTNRSAIDSEVIEADKIADSYAKVMNADFIMSWSRKSKDKLNNTARAHIMKNRFGQDGITFPCKMDTNTGYIVVYDGTSPDGVIAQKQAASGQLETKKLLHKKYVENMG